MSETTNLVGLNFHSVHYYRRPSSSNTEDGSEPEEEDINTSLLIPQAEMKRTTIMSHYSALCPIQICLTALTG